MKSIKNILIYSIFIIAAQTGSYNYALWNPPKKRIIKDIDEVLKIVLEEVDTIASNHLPAATQALAEAGADFGRNICVGTLETIGAGMLRMVEVAKYALIVGAVYYVYKKIESAYSYPTKGQLGYIYP